MNGPTVDRGPERLRALDPVVLRVKLRHGLGAPFACARCMARFTAWGQLACVLAARCPLCGGTIRRAR